MATTLGFYRKCLALSFMIFLVYGPYIVLSLCLVLLLTKLRYVIICYWIWTFYDRKSTKRCKEVSKYWRTTRFQEAAKDYFPLNLVKTADLDPSKNYIFGCHPHGLFPFGSTINLSTYVTGFDKLFPKINARIHLLNLNFHIPFCREYQMFVGNMSVDKNSIEWLLTKNGKGNAAAIAIGGIVEAFDALPNTMKLTLKKRKGFVKLAIQTGTSLVPVITFGENEAFSQRKQVNRTFRRFQQIVKSISGTFVPALNTWLPTMRPITTVVGAPIDVALNTNPSEKEVDELHELYCKSLSDLFYANRELFAEDKRMKIEFI